MRPKPKSRWPLTATILMSDLLATVHFVQFYLLNMKEYLRIPDYVAGTERLPYQRRLLMMLLYRTVGRSGLLLRFCSHFKGIYGHPDLVIDLLVDLFSLGVAGLAATLLYRAASREKRYTLLVYPVFLAVAASTYLVNNEAFGRYLYDLPALAFFTLGLYFAYTGRYLWLAATLAVGTLNRETTLFLIPAYALTSLLRQPEGQAWKLRWRVVPWGRTLVLAALWLGEKAVLSRMYRQNDASEDFIHLRSNLVALAKPGDWPQILSACAFLLPILWMLRRRVRDRAVTATIYLFPFWIAVMMLYALVIESRVFGELCGYCATLCVLLLEEDRDSRTGLG